MYVTAPARRAFQTSENELLVLLLEAIVRHSRQLGWHRSSSEGVGKLISGRVSQAERWLQVRALLEVERRPMTASKIARIRSGRHRRRYASALAAYQRYKLLAEKLDRASIRAAVESFGIISRDDATLFELICIFRTLDALQSLGWRLTRLGLFAGALRIRGLRGDSTVAVSYQTTPPALSANSEYRRVQRAHDISPGGLRPDLVMRIHSSAGRRWLVIEAKGGHRPITESARAAVYDLLAYRTAFSPQLDLQDGVYGLGIVWGSEVRPDFETGITLCSPDTLAEALSRLTL